MPASPRLRVLSRGRAPRPRAAANARAPASPKCILLKESQVTAGSAPAPSPSASRCTPSGPAEFSTRPSCSSAGSTEPSVPSNAISVAVRPLSTEQSPLSSRSSLQLRSPTLSCGSSACVAVRSSLLALLKATARRGSSTLHSWTKTLPCSSPLSFESAIAPSGSAARGGRTHGTLDKEPQEYTYTLRGRP
eukprot:scaffold95782_cov54-Phaeocystis_antarctica.AAC.2